MTCYLHLSVDISDAALAAAWDVTRSDVELRRVGKLVDARVGALAAAVNAARVAGFPSGWLFLDSIEQELAVALISRCAVRHRSVRTLRGDYNFGPVLRHSHNRTATGQRCRPAA
jgi:AraC family transcriptional regulator